MSVLSVSFSFDPLTEHFLSNVVNGREDLTSYNGKADAMKALVRRELSALTVRQSTGLPPGVTVHAIVQFLR
jgi:hypothetical protein